MMPLLGNRGPLNGDPSIESITKKIHPPHDAWSGNLGFADGSVSFFDTLEAATKSIGKNPFANDLGQVGDDPLITFTKEMKEDGPVIQLRGLHFPS
jgi:prepilin-type processing-associated H-X9-DG protein